MGGEGKSGRVRVGGGGGRIGAGGGPSCTASFPARGHPRCGPCRWCRGGVALPGGHRWWRWHRTSWEGQGEPRGRLTDQRRESALSPSTGVLKSEPGIRGTKSTSKRRSLTRGHHIEGENRKRPHSPGRSSPEQGAGSGVRSPGRACLTFSGGRGWRDGGRHVSA